MECGIKLANFSGNLLDWDFLIEFYRQTNQLEKY